MKKCDKFIILTILLILSILLIILGFCLELNLKVINVILFIIGLIMFLATISIIQYYIEIDNQNDDYINDIIMYRKGYTLELRLPRTEIEDRLFREYADEKMIKELDNYLEYNKSVKIFKDDYYENNIKKLIKK